MDPNKINKKNSIFLSSVILITLAIIINIALNFLLFKKYDDDIKTSNLIIESNNKIINDYLKKEIKKRQPVYINIPNAKPIRALVDDYHNPASLWALVNKESSLPVEYVPSPISIPNVPTRTDKSIDERSVRSDIQQPLIDLFNAAESYGYQLLIGSGYRSANLQSIYFYSLARSIGEQAANQSIARPGQSEHQTGLAVDITTVSRQCYLEICFEDTSDGQWLANNAHKYGFILRYKKGKESITGYMYEPWHFRYVGIDLATALFESDLTLEEAWPYLEEALATLKENGAI